MPVRRIAGGLARACHPEPTAVVTAITGSLALAAGRGSGVIWVLSAVLAGQLSVGWSNDFIDRHRDAAAGRRDKPIVAGRVPARLVVVLAVLALASAALLSFGSGWRAALAHLAGLLSAWAYNLGLKATVWSPLPYAIAFGALPAFVLLGLPGHRLPPWWMTVAGALLGLGAHFANVVPDIDDDLRAGVTGLPQRLGARGSALTAGGLLLAASIVLAVGPAFDAVGVLAIVIAAVASLGLVLSQQPFRFALVVAALDVALLITRGVSLP